MYVSVPVLSKTTVWMSRVRSSASIEVIRMPSCAPRPVPVIVAIGVARPSAQGQAMIRTATAASMAWAVSPANSDQPMKVTIEIPITVGTNTAETRSARRCMSDLPDWASSTSRTIWASAVSPPTAVARMVSTPEVFRVAPATVDPSVFSTGSDRGR